MDALLHPISILIAVGAGLAAAGITRILGGSPGRAGVVGLITAVATLGAIVGAVWLGIVAVPSAWLWVSELFGDTAGLSVGGLVFFGLAALVLVSALGVAFSSNILYSGFALMGTLVGVAGLYLFIGADFVGIAQLLIYIGGILVLILFAVLLTNRIGMVTVTNRGVHRGIAAVITLGIFGMLLGLYAKTELNVTDAVATPTTVRIGDALLREYLLPFELVSLVLLMALVGAMVIARRAARVRPADDSEAAPGLGRLE